ncbi:unnamed protein product [Laminaria digitata]
MTSAQSGTDVLCIKHGGGKRCLVSGCRKLVRKSNRCTKHASQVSGTDDAPPPRQQQPPLPPPPLPLPLSPLATRAAAMKISASTAPAAVGAAATRTAAPSFEHRSPQPLPMQMPRPLRYQSSASTASSEYAYREINFDRSSNPSADRGRGDGGGGGGGGGGSSGNASAFDRAPGVASSLRGKLSLNGNGLARFPHPAGVASSEPSSLNRHLLGTMEPRNAVGGTPAAAASVARTDSSELPHMSAAAQLLSLGANSLLSDCTGASASGGGGGGGGGGSDCNGGGGGAEGGGRGIVDDILTLSNKETAASTVLALSRSNARYKGFGDGVGERLQYPPPTSSPLPLQSFQLPPPPALAAAAAPAPRVMGGFDAPGGWSREGHVSGGGGGGGGGGGEHASLITGVARSHALSVSGFAEKGPLLAGQSPSSPALGLSAPMAQSSANTNNSNSSNNNSNNRVQQQPSLTGRPSPSSSSTALAPAAARPEAVPEAALPVPIRPLCCGGQASVAGGAPPGRVARLVDGTNESESRSPPPLAPTYISLSVLGMMCMENCGQTVQRALSLVPGVRSVTVHFPTRTASVQVEPETSVSPADLTAALDGIGFSSSCIATSTTEESPLEEAGVNAVWAIATALGLVDRGCAMAWGELCNCGEDCKCVNCPQHMKKVSHAVELVLKAVDLSSGADPPTPAQPDVTTEK